MSWVRWDEDNLRHQDPCSWAAEGGRLECLNTRTKTNVVGMNILVIGLPKNGQLSVWIIRE